jgi:hypothetical protein
VIKGFYNGCSVRLRNGLIVRNVWFRPKAGATGLYVSYKYDLVQAPDEASTIAEVESVKRKFLGVWHPNGHLNLAYQGQYELGIFHPELDLEEALTKKDTMDIPERNTDAFIDHVTKTVLQWHRTGKCWYRRIGDTEWRTAATPTWEWARFDYHWQDPSPEKPKEDVNAALLKTYEKALKEIASMSSNILAYDRACLAHVKATHALGKSYPHDWRKDAYADKPKEDVNAELLKTYEKALKEIASMSDNTPACERACLAQVKATKALGKTYPYDWSKDD